MNAYYQPDLAWVHHNGYFGHVEQTRPGIVRRLRDHGLSQDARVLDVGCGSGLLARALLAEGFRVSGVDASEAMITLARGHAPAASFSGEVCERFGEETLPDGLVVLIGRRRCDFRATGHLTEG